MALKGIDVSEHQGSIDWNQVKASGVQFAMIRAEYGWILVLNSSATSRIQVIFKYSASGISEISMRGYTNSRWYPWRKIATEAV